MHSYRSFRPLFVLLLALLFAPWPAEARPSETHRADAAASPQIERFIGWLVTLWGDVGCTVDPSGGCLRESLDVGCTVDPDGRGCRESLDTACGWDPNGGGCRGNG